MSKDVTGERDVAGLREIFIIGNAEECRLL
jgi:hypothetical protein